MKRVFLFISFILFIIVLVLNFSLTIYAQSNKVRIAIINFKANDNISQQSADRFTELVRVIFTNKGIWDVITPSEVQNFFKKNNITTVTDEVISSIEYDEKFGAKFILYGNLYRNQNNKKQITIVAKIYDVKNRKLLLGVLQNIDENRLLDISDNAPIYQFVDKLEKQIFNSIGAKAKEKPKPVSEQKPKKITIDAMIGFNFPIRSTYYDPEITFYDSNKTSTIEKINVSGGVNVAFQLGIWWNFYSFLTLNFDVFFYNSSTQYDYPSGQSSLGFSTSDSAFSIGLGVIFNSFKFNILAGLYSIDNLGGYPFSLVSDGSEDLMMEASYLSDNLSYLFSTNVVFDLNKFNIKIKGGYILLNIVNGHSSESIEDSILDADEALKANAYLVEINLSYMISKVFGFAFSTHLVYWNVKVPYSSLQDDGITTYSDGINITGVKTIFSGFVFIKTGF